MSFLLLILLFVFSFSSFGNSTRKGIWKRDKGVCVTCGKKYCEGFHLECSHYDHDKRKDTYNTVQNGRLQCYECHFEYHFQLLKTSILNGDVYSIQAHLRACQMILERKNKDGKGKGIA